jgi:hypothetical protein
MTADSIVLQKGTCFGDCAAYRVSISRTGDVRITFIGQDGGARVQRARIGAEDFQELMIAATGASFVSLPDSIESSPVFCVFRATDAQDVSVTLYMTNRVKRVADYLGCSWAPAALRNLEELIETTARRPNHSPGR